jgi:hypothetical protein
MAKRTLLSKVGCLVAAGGLVAGCGVEPGTESDAQPVGAVRQAIAHGKRFNTLAEPSGAARAELQVYRHSDNTSYMLRMSDGFDTGVALSRPAATEDVPVQGNFDGDSLYDVATFRPSNGQYAVRRSSTGLSYTFGFGVFGDLPAVGDFDGDGATDHGVWRPSNGIFYALKSSDTTQYLSVALGQNGDIPVVGNYDGDSKDDFAVWRPCTGTWHFLRSSTGVVEQFQYGMSGDVPVPADYDGDGRTDFAVFRPSNGTWYLRFASTGATWSTVYGGLNDYPVPADYDGDGKAEIAFWRASDGRHHLRYSSTGAIGSVVYGGSGDVPVNTNVYCKNSQGLVRPCNSANVHSGQCSVNGVSASISITVDNTYDLYLNGTRIGGDSDSSEAGWRGAETYSVTVSSGDVVAVRGADTGIGSGLLASIALGNGVTYTSGSSWKCTPTLFSGWNTRGFSDAAWPSATQYGANGTAPWGQISGISASAQWIWTNDNQNHETAYCRFTLP